MASACLSFEYQQKSVQKVGYSIPSLSILNVIIDMEFNIFFLYYNDHHNKTTYRTHNFGCYCQGHKATLKQICFRAITVLFIFVLSWCTSSVGFWVLPLMDNRHLGSIHHFQRYSCYLYLLLYHIVLYYTQVTLMNYLLTY